MNQPLGPTGRPVPPPRGGRCKDCDATIQWVLTEAHRRPMPLDVDATEDGNVVLVGGLARVFGVRVTPDVPGPRRTSHFATCPERAKRPDPHFDAVRKRKTRHGHRRRSARR